jgi:peptidoglycan hydrolase CwlO-like protein
MKKSELKELIREIVLRKLNEADMVASVSDDQKGNVEAKSDIEPKDDTKQMSSADQSKLNSLKTKQDKINNDIRKIDGTIQKLKAPVLKKQQDLDRKNAKHKQDAGRISAEIEKIQKKYNK